MAASVVEERAREAMFTRISDQVKALVTSQVLGPELPSQQRQLAGKRPSLPICFEQSSSAASRRGPCMPMWPSPRFLWPPSCCMSSCWSVEPSGFLVAERSRTYLQRGWGSHEDERICPIFGCAGGLCLRWPQEVVVDGLPVFGALHGDGRPRRGAAVMDGVAILAARRAKERRCPEFVGVQAPARLVVLVVEIGSGSRMR